MTFRPPPVDEIAFLEATGSAGAHRIEPRDPRRQGPLTIDEIPHLLPYRSVSSSRGRGWDGITIDVYKALPELSESYPALDHHMIGFCSAGSAHLVQARAGQVHAAKLSAGMSLLMPAGYESRWEGAAPAMARLRVPQRLVASAAERLGKAVTQLELRNSFQTRDTTVERIALTLVAELDRPAHPAQRLLVDALSCAMAAHLVCRYNALEFVEPVRAPALTPSELQKIETHIEENMDRSIGLTELAAVVNLSRFHFARLFRQSTGMTAVACVEQSRIRRAQDLIAKGEHSIVEVALITGFADQSHFTRRFHKQVGCTPGAYLRRCAGNRQMTYMIRPA